MTHDLKFGSHFFVEQNFEGGAVPKAVAASARQPFTRKIVIDQSDMYTHVLTPVAERKDIKYKFVVAVLVEYIRSLNHFQIPVQVMRE